jgi:hypothetical protein
MAITVLVVLLNPVASSNVLCQTGQSFKNGSLIRVEGPSAELSCDPGFVLETEEKFLRCQDGQVLDDVLVNCIEATDEGASARLRRSTSQITQGLDKNLKRKAKKRHHLKKKVR